MEIEFIAKTLQGLEEVLAKEIADLGGQRIRIERKMVHFTGDKSLLYKSNLYLRTALRVLMPIRSFSASDPDEVYEQVRSIPWEDYIPADRTFIVDTLVHSEFFRHSKFLSYRVKDGITDHYAQKAGKHPSLRLTNPDIHVHVYVSHQQCTVSLDSSGESLHKRGYRVDGSDHSFNEVFAAGLLLSAGWNGQCPFVDPMCGPGILLIEAALIALKIPPGIYRKSFAFEKWMDFDAEIFEQLFNDEADEQPFNYVIQGSDVSPKAVSTAEMNIKNASLSKYIRLENRSFQKLTNLPENGMAVLIPPHGERFYSADVMPLYESIGERLKPVFPGYEVWVLAYREECFDRISLRSSDRIRLTNEGQECELRKYEVFGKKKKFFSNAQEPDEHE